MEIEAVPDETSGEVSKCLLLHSLATWNVLKHGLSRALDIVNLNWKSKQFLDGRLAIFGGWVAPAKPVKYFHKAPLKATPRVVVGPFPY
ncbi:uncharacterized protein N7500_005218 [Penicillium coprophilum]|uniref:uncharacterized protein n=1 Tax=Penicillium coprophilum TaxID=36646 RepID=UPI0023A683F0|nr:uncharacterized protein N7500_005218 [Penicillium coprophilum]KAJ5163388.1 hypothetical protein N7500_005218 [Penicillium coprophilum]